MILRHHEVDSRLTATMELRTLMAPWPTMTYGMTISGTLAWAKMNVEYDIAWSTIEGNLNRLLYQQFSNYKQFE